LNVTKLRLLGIGGSIFAIIILMYYYYGLPISQQNHNLNNAGTDRFEIKDIYPTKNGGREWSMDMDNPTNDKTFSITSHIPVTRNNDDGSWFIDKPEVRMNVNTPKGEPLWKNVEITGYVKPTSVINSGGNGGGGEGQEDEESTEGDEKNISPDISWRARGGVHRSSTPCEGTALNGVLNINDEKASWKKEIWHTGGYTDARGTTQATNDPLLGKWVGWKVIMYNTDNDKAVKMESYIDDNNKNDWKKITELTDDGGWFANSSDDVFYSADCGKPKDYIITNGGSIVTFRSDNISYYFKNLSVREIQPPS
jgi:hypothetical protein